MKIKKHSQKKEKKIIIILLIISFYNFEDVLQLSMHRDECEIFKNDV